MPKAPTDVRRGLVCVVLAELCYRARTTTSPPLRVVVVVLDAKRDIEIDRIAPRRHIVNSETRRRRDA